MSIGPCLCGDPYCAFCGNPVAAAMEEWIDHLCEITADFDEEQARIFETVGMAAVKAYDDAQKSIRRKRMGEWEEPRTRPIQGGWLEKDTLTGDVREPLTQPKERERP